MKKKISFNGVDGGTLFCTCNVCICRGSAVQNRRLCGLFQAITDFGYYFTYSVEKTNTNYKCFSVVENGQRVYAAVKESLYDYYKNVFNDQDVTFKGEVQRFADDGAPVIMATWKVVNEDGKETSHISWMRIQHQLSIKREWHRI